MGEFIKLAPESGLALSFEDPSLGDLTLLILDVTLCGF